MMRVFTVLLLFLIGPAYSQEKEMAFIESRGNINLKIRAADSLFNNYLELDLVRASAFAKKFLDLSKQSGAKIVRIKALQAMSLVSAYQGDYSGSILYGKEGLELSIIENDSSLMMVGYINQGDNYLELGRFDQAYFFTYKAQEIAIRINSLLDQAFTIHNFGRIYKELGQYDLAIENFKKSDSISNTLNDSESKFYTAWEMGNLYHRQGKFDLAYANLKKALDLSVSLGIRVMQPDVQLDIARYYTDHNRLDEAETYYDSALTLFRSFRNKLGEAKVGLGYGRIFLKKGLLKEANQKFNEVLTVAEELNARSIQISVLEELSKLEESRGDFRKSLSYFKQYNSLHDSLFSRELLDQTFKYQLQFLVDTKDNEIDALNQVNELRQAEISRQHLLRNVIIVVFLLTIGLLYLVYRSNRRKQQLNNLLLAHQSELERRSLELEELNKLKDKFFSIISHDLRSPINSLAGVLNLMEKNGVSPQELPELTRELRLQFNHTKNLITNLLSWAMLQMDKIAIKMESLDLRRLVDENFVLASSMTSKQMNLVNDVDAGTMIFADQNMFNLIIRNLVMNAIKFTEPGGQVRVSSEARGSDVIVMVEDTGIGISPEVQKILMSKENSNYTTRGTMNEKGTGLGISLCKEFIERNNGRMWLVSTVNKGTTFFVSVPKSAK